MLPFTRWVKGFSSALSAGLVSYTIQLVSTAPHGGIYHKEEQTMKKKLTLLLATMLAAAMLVSCGGTSQTALALIHI